ncbi:ATP-grasp protein-like protein [Halococcus thailandensis JCM 13552]|uniref:ATP-grasp protein-like protein n=1 Tax=Halococcus thailandensis JCM 13552 TaxID=1227457 RepID=M0NDY4_9EURY|nr:ATP-grasp protein-like protein [Halococcus thailandensis JCM 13552]
MVVIPATISIKSLACVRSLGRHGVRTIVASEFETPPAAHSRYCDELVAIPSPHEDLLAYKDALVSLAARPDVWTIVPTREEVAYLLSKHRAEFAEHVAVGWPTFESLRTVHDGYRLAEHAADVGVPVPETRLLTEISDWNPDYIVKQRYSILTPDYADFLGPRECKWNGVEPIYLESGVEPDIDAIVGTMLGEVPVVQEVVRGTEYSFRALYDHGTPVATSLRRQVRGKTYAGGASVFRELTRDPALEELARRLLDSLDWHGVATVQFIKNEETDETTLVEINPRIWSSISLDIRAGADFPYHYWLMTRGESTYIDSTHRTDVATHLLFGELQYLRSVLRDDFPNVDRPTFRQAIADVGLSVWHHPHFDFLCLDDPIPFVRTVIDTFFEQISEPTATGAQDWSWTSVRDIVDVVVRRSWGQNEP